MLAWLLTGGLIPIALIGCGLFFTFYLRGRPLTAPRRMLSALRTEGAGAKQGESPFRAVTLALAGTLGVGNIVGVANAISVGGAGAVLWMWVSALFAMLLKYAEILLAVAHRRQKGDGAFFGGAVYYLEDLLLRLRRPRLSRILPALFSLLLLLNSLSMGCAIQANAVSEAAKGIWGAPQWYVGLLLLLLTLPWLIGGGRLISRLTERLVPLMTLGYVLLSVAALLAGRDRIGAAVEEILAEALRPSSAVGGVIGFLTSRALRVGTMRGLLSNEAGCGTAPTAHAAADAKSPAEQGVWGIVEVFVDTILLCTATALVILVSPNAQSSGSVDVMLTVEAYASLLGGWSRHFLGAAIFCFGWATLLCWGKYGLESLAFLTSRRTLRLGYLLLFGLCTLLGATLAPGAIWGISDFAIATLTSINLCALLAMRKEIRTETDRLVGIRPKKRKPHG